MWGNKSSMIPKLIFGLRNSRIREWLYVLKIEGGNLTLLEKISTLRKMGIFASTALFDKTPKSVARQRYKTCLRCIVFNPTTRACRAARVVRNGEIEKYGCGCYVPYLVVSSRKPCWAKERNDERGWN